ncbi:MAG: ABC transporter ATP-binding protein [Pseudomonadota bacterium]
MTQEIVIATDGLSKRFGGFTAVDGLSMQIPAQTVHGFLGPNGSGKTTAIRMMCGLLDPSEGSVSVLGMRVPEQAALVRRQVGYMTQRFSMYEDLSVRQNLVFLCRVHGIRGRVQAQRIGEVIEEFDLVEIAHRKAGPLSGGQKRRLALAGAVLTRPRLLILDEPTSEVDPNTRRDMWESFFRIASTGTSILVSTHMMDEAERCHNLTIMDHGRKVGDGSVQSLKSQLAESVLVVSGPDVAAVTPRLKQAPEVVSAAQSGLQLRVIVRQGVERPDQLLCRLAGDGYQVVPAAATIEDVFVILTNERGGL